jgi:hypothetical protein
VTLVAIGGTPLMPTTGASTQAKSAFVARCGSVAEPLMDAGNDQFDASQPLIKAVEPGACVIEAGDPSIRSRSILLIVIIGGFPRGT